MLWIFVSALGYRLSFGSKATDLWCTSTESRQIGCGNFLNGHKDYVESHHSATLEQVMVFFDGDHVTLAFMLD